MLGAAVIAAAVGIPVAILVSRGGASSVVTPPVASPTPNPSQRAAAAQASALYAQVLTAAEGGFTEGAVPHAVNVSVSVPAPSP